MIKKTNKRPQVGDSALKDALIIEELFTADNVRWVRCTKLRRKLRVWYNAKRYTIYDTENTYLTESEWLKLKIQ